jgi:hypothetical protein
VLNRLSKDEIAEKLLKEMTSPWTSLDITGVEFPLACASIDRLDPQGDHTLANSRVVEMGIILFSGNALNDRYLIRALNRWKGLPDC